MEKFGVPKQGPPDRKVIKDIAQVESQVESKHLKALSKEFFDIQLAFVKAMHQKTGETLDNLLLTHTCFYRRFGLGIPDAASSANPQWEEFIRGYSHCRDDLAKTDYVYKFYLNAPEAPAIPKEFCFGFFSFEPVKDDGVVNLHYENRDNDGHSPISHSKFARRIQELTEMLTYIRQTYPNARLVRSGSWLHSIEKLRKLFPPEFNASCAPITPNGRFQGLSRWGQFLQYDGRIRSDLAAQFLKNLEHFDASDPVALFPLTTFRAEAPIDVFYAFYGISDRAS